MYTLLKETHNLEFVVHAKRLYEIPVVTVLQHGNVVLKSHWTQLTLGT